MAQLELTHHQMFPEEGDLGWHAGQMPDGRRVHAASMPCNAGEIHWAGSVEDSTACECDHSGTCNLCLIRADGDLVFTRVTGCYRSLNSAVRALQHWAANPDGPQPPAPFNCRWTTMQAVLCQGVPGAPPMPLGTTESPFLSSQEGTPQPDLEHQDHFEFDASDYDIPNDYLRYIAIEQITPESLDECSESGHPRQAWLILSEQQEAAVTCPICGQVPDFDEKSITDESPFTYDGISETLNETHSTTHDIFRDEDAEEITFWLQSYVSQDRNEWPKPGSANLTRLPYPGDDAITLRWFRDEWNEHDHLAEDVELLHPDTKERLTEESLREFVAEEREAGFSYESAAKDIVNATMGLDDDEDDDEC